MKISKIVITGGPCAGKTTATGWIQTALTRKGYTVLFVPETATELITGGVAPWTCGTNIEYQQCQIELQLEKERIFEQAARTMDVDKVLIVCDRGMMDNKAYMSEEDFEKVLEIVNSSEQEFCDRYDAVFHLLTAAKVAEEFYTTANNSARIETLEEAAILDDKIIDAWKSHKNLHIIRNNTSHFEDKMKKLVAEIISFLEK